MPSANEKSPKTTLHDDPFEYVECRHGLIKIIANDTVVGKSLRTYGEWAENELSFVSSFVPKGAMVLDVGAYIGTHALAFADMVGIGGTVISVEPQRQYFHLLQENVKANHLPHVRLINASVGEVPKKILIPDISPDQCRNFGGLTIKDATKDFPSNDLIAVQVITLDSLALDRCDFIKIDVEGAESNVLQGGLETMRKFRPVIYAECNSLEGGAKCLNILESLDYSVFLHLSSAFNSGNYMKSEDNIFGDAREAALVAIRSDQRHQIVQANDPSGQLFELQTLDDLAYAMLQKPQYFDDVLRAGMAAKCGGSVNTMHEHRLLRSDFEATRKELHEARRQLKEEGNKLDAARKVHELVEVKMHQDLVAARDALTRVRSLNAKSKEALASECIESARAQQQHRDLLVTVAHLEEEAGELRRIKSVKITRLLVNLIMAEVRFWGKVRGQVQVLKSKLAFMKKLRWGAVQFANPRLATVREAPAGHGKQIAICPISDTDSLPVWISQRPLLVCITHVVPWPPRAGNEYRIHRLLSWIRSIGWDVALVLSPLPGEGLGEEEVTSLAREYQNVIVADRHRSLLYQIARADLLQAVIQLSGVEVRDFATLLGENTQQHLRHINEITSTFSPDLLLETIEAIDKHAKPTVFLANYCFMTRGLALLRKEVVKIVDTHDVFSTKESKVTRFKISDLLTITRNEERHLLENADYVLAIQPEEAEELRTLGFPGSIVTVGVDMPESPTVGGIADRPVLLMVGSANNMNKKGLRDFLHFAWPLILRSVPEAELNVVGSVGEILDGFEERVRWLGHVDDLTLAYTSARVVINPAVAGTGLKVKTLEALSHLRPIIVWPLGLEGVESELQAYCVCVTDWYSFAQAVCEFLTDDQKAGYVTRARKRIDTLLSAEHVYAELAVILKTHEQ